jgi:deoxyribodipyrimidine photo-lyase
MVLYGLLQRNSRFLTQTFDCGKNALFLGKSQRRNLQSIFHPMECPMMKYRKQHERVTHALQEIRQQRLIIKWFRLGDLRIHDNCSLFRSAEDAFDSRLALRKKKKQPREDSCYVLPIFCFDKSLFGKEALSPSGDLKMSPKRAKFILESVTDLRSRLENEAGSKLLIGLGDPRRIFASLLEKIDPSVPVTIYVQDDPIREGRQALRYVNGAMIARQNSKIIPVWDSSIFDPKYINFGGKNVYELPATMDEFRVQVESRGKMRHPIYPIPKYLAFPEPETRLFEAIGDMTSYMPTLHDLGYTDEQIEFANRDDPRSAIVFHGGESAALERVNEYIWERDLLKASFTTKDDLIGPNYSSKLSPYLAHGCLSPKFLLEEVKRYRKTRINNTSTFWYEYNLRKREFCKLYFVKWGDRVFLPGGTVDNEKVWTTNAENLKAWKEGRTGYPLVDACMRELKATGYMSKLGRQVTAYFLTYHLSHDWRDGGDWFESNLIDHDVYSNWVVSAIFFVVHSLIHLQLTRYLRDSRSELVYPGRRNRGHRKTFLSSSTQRKVGALPSTLAS